jgi:hypothetical protein
MVATYGLNDIAFILIDGYSLNGYITELSDTKEATLEEATCAGASWQTWAFTGEKRFNFSMAGFYDDADDALNEALCEQFTARTICYGVEGNTVGKEVAMLYGPTQGKYERVASRGELHKASAEYEGSGEVEDGKIIATLTSRGAASNTNATPVNNGGASTGGACYLQVSALALGGYTNLVVTMQDSADSVTFADMASGEGVFTAVTTAPAKQRLALTVSIKQYVSMKWTWTGSGTGNSFTGFVGLHRN